MAILTVGIDLAKNVFELHGVNKAGKPELLQPRVPRAELHASVAALPPCTIGIEACSGAHHWVRLFQAHGPSVRLIAPKLVTPYHMSGKRGKNDAADAAAIGAGFLRRNLPFVVLWARRPVPSLGTSGSRRTVLKAHRGSPQALPALPRAFNSPVLSVPGDQEGV